MTSRRTFCIGLAASTLPGVVPASAQEYPTKVIRLLVPYSAGGGTDAIGRLVANGVGERLGKVMIVENNGSAGGNVATTQASMSAPDGYTVLMANQGPMVVNPHLFKNLKVDPLTAFDPITLITAVPLILVVPPNSPYKSLQELIEFARKNPDKINYGSAGNGSASHLATVLLAQMANIKISHIPYRGAGPALNDLMGGRTDLMVTTVPSVVSLVEKVKPLAVTTKVRSKKFPDTPTIAESGFPDYEASAWYGFVVPKGTPRPIIDKLRQATVDTINNDVVKSRLEAEGAEPIGSTPEAFAEMMKAESQRWAAVIKEAGVTVD